MEKFTSIGFRGILVEAREFISVIIRIFSVIFQIIPGIVFPTCLAEFSSCLSENPGMLPVDGSSGFHNKFVVPSSSLRG